MPWHQKLTIIIPEKWYYILLMCSSCGQKKMFRPCKAQASRTEALSCVHRKGLCCCKPHCTHVASASAVVASVFHLLSL